MKSNIHLINFTSFRLIDANKNSIYEGMFNNNQKHGEGVQYEEGAKIEGKWDNGILYGYAKCTLPNGETSEKIFM